jgi:hypothetical protein
VAVLINQTSNLQLRLELRRRLSDGVRSAAALEMSVAVERYLNDGHRFAPLLEVRAATLLDLDLIHFLQQLEELLDGAARAPEGQQPAAALEASVDPAIGVRIIGGPDAFLIETGVDLLNILELVGGAQGERGADLALFRFFANARAVVAFCGALLAEFAKFPTDPSAVDPGIAQ